MKHTASRRFWDHHNALPDDIKRLANDAYELMKADTRHPSIHLKKIGRFWSARIGLHYRSLAIEEGDDLVWFWIGPHKEYERLIRSM